MMRYAGLNFSFGCLQRGHFQSSGRSSKATPSCSAGYLPLTQTINAMVMEDLFFLVHVYHVLTNYTITALF
jgi:hypothetical protein